MQIEGAEPGRRQHRRRQDLAEGDDHGGVEAERRKGLDLGWIAHGNGRAGGQAVGFSEGLDR